MRRTILVVVIAACASGPSGDAAPRPGPSPTIVSAPVEAAPGRREAAAADGTGGSARPVAAPPGPLLSGDLLWWEGRPDDGTTALRRRRAGVDENLLFEPHEPGYLPRGAAASAMAIWARLPEGRRHGQPGEVRLWRGGEPVTLDDEALWPQRPRLSGQGEALWIDLVRRQPDDAGRSALAVRVQGATDTVPRTLWQGEAFWVQVVAWEENPAILVIEPDANTIVELGAEGRRIEVGAGIARDVQATGDGVRLLFVPRGQELAQVRELQWDGEVRILAEGLPPDASPRMAGGRLHLNRMDPETGVRHVPEDVVRDTLVERLHPSDGPPRWLLGGRPLGTAGHEVVLLGQVP